MQNDLSVRVDLDKILVGLFCLFAFVLPFELFLEMVFDIDTKLKPFRIASLLIIAVYGLKILRGKFSIHESIKTDLFLYSLLLYGIVISLVRIVTGVFNFGLFYNDLFQIGLLSATYFIFKNTAISVNDGKRILNFFLLGFLVNSLYTANEYFILGHLGRQSGFLDNPNYAGLGLVAAMIYIALKLNYTTRWRSIIWHLLMLVLFFNAFLIAASRTSVLLLVMSGFLVIIFSKTRFRIFASVGIAIMVLMLLLPQKLDFLNVSASENLSNRLGSVAETSDGDVRFVIWRGIFRSLEDNGYWGMGMGQFKAKFPHYYVEESNKLVMEIVNRGYHLSSHNDLLAILTDFGLPGALMFSVFLLLSLRAAFLNLLKPVDKEETKIFIQYSFIIVLCLIIFGITAENLPNPLFWFLLMIATKTFYVHNPSKEILQD